MGLGFRVLGFRGLKFRLLGFRGMKFGVLWFGVEGLGFQGSSCKGSVKGFCIELRLLSEAQPKNSGGDKTEDQIILGPDYLPILCLKVAKYHCSVMCPKPRSIC